MDKVHLCLNGHVIIALLLTAYAITLFVVVQGGSRSLNESINVGPWGGDGGTYWSFKAEGGITEIVILYGSGVIESITFKGDNGSGKVEYSNTIGGDSKYGGQTNQILLDWPGEFLMSISGTYVLWGVPFPNYVIKSLTFYTNRTKYGPFGTGCDTVFREHYFSFPMEDGVIVGFHGRANDVVDAIGVYVKPLASYCSISLESLKNQEANNVMNVDVPRGPGPWGGHGGKQFDDGVFSAIQQVHVHVGNAMVHAIQILYESRDGKSVWSTRHGGPGGDTINRIKLDGSSEYLVGIMGFYGRVEGNGGLEALRSVTFYTNKRKHGAFGNEIGIAFTSPVSSGKLVGFHGRSGVYLDALGVHMEFFWEGIYCASTFSNFTCKVPWCWKFFAERCVGK